MTAFLQKALDKRKELFAEGRKLRAEGDKLFAEWDKLFAEGRKLFAEGCKLRAEGDKLFAEGDKLCAEGDIIFYDEVIAKFGKDAVVTWNDDGSVEIEPHATKITLK